VGLVVGGGLFCLFSFGLGKKGWKNRTQNQRGDIEDIWETRFNNNDSRGMWGY
jgi:hypothetical protein